MNNSTPAPYEVRELVRGLLYEAPNLTYEQFASRTGLDPKVGETRTAFRDFQEVVLAMRRGLVDYEKLAAVLWSAVRR